MPKTQQAIRPDNFPDVRAVIAKNDFSKPEIIEEKQLAALSLQDGWKVLKTFIQELSNELDGVNKQVIERGASFEEIGKNAVVTQLAKDKLNRVIQKVEDAGAANESA